MSRKRRTSHSAPKAVAKPSPEARALAAHCRAVRQLTPNPSGTAASSLPGRQPGPRAAAEAIGPKDDRRHVRGAEPVTSQNGAPQAHTATLTSSGAHLATITRPPAVTLSGAVQRRPGP